MAVNAYCIIDGVPGLAPSLANAIYILSSASAPQIPRFSDRIFRRRITRRTG